MDFCDSSYIADVVSDMAKLSDHRGRLARYIEVQTHRQVGNRIVLALTEWEERDLNAGFYSPGSADLIKQLLFFCQEVMNHVCMKARQEISEISEEDLETEGKIIESVSSDHFYLSNVYSYLADKTDFSNYIGPLRFYLHADEKQDSISGEIIWSFSHIAMDFQEAMLIMARMADKVRVEDDPDYTDYGFFIEDLETM